jgi:hypothetical protein
LNVVADAIDEEVGGGGVPTEDGGVAVALALGDAGAGHVASDVADAAHGLIVDELAGDNGEGLRDIDEGSVGLGGGDAALAGVGFLAAIADLEFLELHGVSLGRQVARRGGGRGLGESGDGEADRERQKRERGAASERGGFHLKTWKGS